MLYGERKMDKLKTRVLFIALIILALVSVSAVAAADVDDVVSVEQDDIDLSEETVSDVEDTQEPILADDPSDDVNEDGSSNVTVFIEVKNATGDVITRNISGVATPDKDWVLSKSTLYNRAGQNVETTSEYSYVCTGILDEDGNNVTSNRNFAATGRNYTVTYKATYTEALNSFITVFVEIRNKTGDVTLGNITGVVYDGKSSWTLSKSTLYSTFGKNVFTESEYSYLFAGSILDEDGNNVTKNKYFPNTGSNYSVSTYKVLYTESHNSRITTVYEVMTSNGPINNTGPTNVLTYNSKSWSIGKNTFDNQIANYKSCDYEGYHYTFDHWVDKDGNTVTPPYKVYWTEEDYNATFKAVYNKEKIGSLRVNYIDTISHGGGGMNYTEHATDYKHTFKKPADIPSGALFLYWENENGTKYSPGDNLTIKYAEFKGIDKVVNVYAVYDIETSVELEEITDYVEEVIDITANITSDVFKVDDPNGGTATLTIVYGDGNTYTKTVDVENGKAVFKDVKLENPGNFTYKVEYSRYSYNKHDEGINDYLPSSAESKLHVLALNTTVSNESATGKPGENVHVEFTVTDQNDHPVANGTLTVIVDGTTYTDEVKEGKVAFDIVLPNPGNYSYDVNYEGNDYYNPSVGQLNLTVQKVDVIVTLPEVINYTGAVVDIVVDVVDEYGNLVNEGTVTLIIDWGTKLSDKLMATAQTITKEVHDGKATFSGITLGEPGTYPSKAEFSGTDYYNEAEDESDVIVLPLNTTTESQDVSGKAGDKKDITADIVDQNGKPVKNGTAVLKVNGKEYTAEVKDGKATFKDVELPDESTEATIEYLGNEYYNPSKTTIQITIIPEDEPIDDNETEEEPSTPTSEKTVPVIPAAGNPIALVVVALLSLVSTVSFGRKK